FPSEPSRPDRARDPHRWASWRGQVFPLPRANRNAQLILTGRHRASRMQRKGAAWNERAIEIEIDASSLVRKRCIEETSARIRFDSRGHVAKEKIEARTLFVERFEALRSSGEREGDDPARRIRLDDVTI